MGQSWWNRDWVSARTKRENALHPERLDGDYCPWRVRKHMKNKQQKCSPQHDHSRWGRSR